MARSKLAENRGPEFSLAHPGSVAARFDTCPYFNGSAPSSPLSEDGEGDPWRKKFELESRVGVPILGRMIVALRRFRPLRRLRAVRATVLRRFGMLNGNREMAEQDEMTFWTTALADGGRNWIPGEYVRRMDPNLPLQEELRALIATAPGQAVRILDVGAGPLTTLGKQWEGCRLEITAIDPLAERYDALLERLNVAPPLRTRAGDGEGILERFPRDHFDLAYSSNALDHAADPLRVIRQMVEVTKPGSYVYLWHFANTGLTESYRGMHQWNFDIRRGDFIIGDGRRERSLTRELAGAAAVSCEKIVDYGKPVVVARLKKSVTL